MESFTLNEYLSIRSAVERIGGGGGGSGVQSLTAGTGIGITGTGGNLTVSASGVQSLTAGSGIGITGTGGNLTVSTSQTPQLIGAMSQFSSINNIPNTERYIIPGFSIAFTPSVNGYVDCNGAFSMVQVSSQIPPIFWQLASVIYDNGVFVSTQTFVSDGLTQAPSNTTLVLPFTLTAPVVAGHTYIIRPEVVATNITNLDSIYAGKISVVFYPNATPLTPS